MTDHVSQNHTINKVAIIQPLLLLFILMAFLLIFLWLIKWLNHTENFPLRQVELVHPLVNQDRQELQKVAAKALNGGFFNLDITEFQAELLTQLPWLKSVAVRKIWPDILLLDIVEYQPIVRWRSNDFIAGDKKPYQLLNTEGIIFAPNLTIPQLHKFNHMSLLFGPASDVKEVLKKWVSINDQLPDVFLSIMACGMDARRSWRVNLLLAEGIEIKIKLNKKAFLPQLRRFIQVFSGQLTSYLMLIDSVDLRYVNGFSVKWLIIKHDKDIGIKN
jgi:cell division protein FtsQ